MLASRLGLLGKWETASAFRAPHDDEIGQASHLASFPGRHIRAPNSMID